MLVNIMKIEIKCQEISSALLLEKKSSVFFYQE